MTKHPHITWSLTETAAPAVEPVTTAEAKSHGRISTSAEDTLIDSYQLAARRMIEEITGRSLITRTYELRLDRLPYSDYSAIILPRGPAQSVASVQYINTLGATQTWSSAEYSVDTNGDYSRLYPAYNSTWPTVRTEPNCVTITYDAGYGDASTDVPQELLHAVKLLFQHMYENREAVTPVSMAVLPMAVEFLIAPYRVRWFGISEDFSP